MPDSRDDKEKEDQADAVPHRQLYECGQSGTPQIRILHFNDVYHPRANDDEPKGGAARLKTMLDYYRDDPEFAASPRPLTLFSGDAFNPSTESSVTKGNHMVPILNELEIDAACVGNHEFDFGAAHFAYLANDCHFPWLLSNIDDPDLGEKAPMGGCPRSWMLKTSNGIKVGVLGLMEREWTEKINNSLPSDIEYTDMRTAAKTHAPELREQGADIVIALTHARQERDFEFCESLPSGLIDIVLAGHDHWVEHKRFSNGNVLVRSGHDFKNLTYTEGYREEDGRWNFSVVRKNLTSATSEDPQMKKLCEDMVADVHRKMESQIGVTAVPLEARTTKCQTQETNYGNFLADLMKSCHGADCALINGGTFFGDKIYPVGALCIKDIVKCFPFEDPVVVLRLKGEHIKKALENGVSQYPEPDSRFPQVSNIRFTFCPGAQSGSRVRTVSIGGEKLDMERTYTIATRSHLASGKCGYDSLKSVRDGGPAEDVVDEENGVLVSGLIRQYFTWIQIVDAFTTISSGDAASDSHQQRVLRELGRSTARWQTEEQRKEGVAKKVFWKWKRVALGKSDVDGFMEEGNGEWFKGWNEGIAPMREGRIVAVRDS